MENSMYDIPKMTYAFLFRLIVYTLHIKHDNVLI